MQSTAHSATPVESVLKGRALLISRIAMGVYVCAVSFAILVRDPRYILTAVLVAFVPAIAGPGAYRFIGIVGAFAAFITFVLIECT